MKSFLISMCAVIFLAIVIGNCGDSPTKMEDSKVEKYQSYSSSSSYQSESEDYTRVEPTDEITLVRREMMKERDVAIDASVFNFLTPITRHVRYKNKVFYMGFKIDTNNEHQVDSVINLIKPYLNQITNIIKPEDIILVSLL